MKLTLLFTGKTEDSYLKEGIEIYAKRLKRYLPLEIKIIGESVKRSKSSAGRARIRESEIITSAVSRSSYIVLLDEKGKCYSSEEFARFIENIMNRGYRELVFVTGGAYGFSDELYGKADHKVSLSDMTFTHQMVRLILTEQLYRAVTIIRGEPYHHE